MSLGTGGGGPSVWCVGVCGFVCLDWAGVFEVSLRPGDQKITGYERKRDNDDSQLQTIRLRNDDRELNICAMSQKLNP